MDTLRAIIDYNQPSSVTESYTASDFPDVEISQEQLEKIILDMLEE
jgi:hypothetical protein